MRESLALLEGAAVRHADMDQGLCRIADALLDELSRRADIPWQRFTVLAEGEFFADLAAVIRLKFPETSLWNLPVAVHEFGHFVAQELKTRAPDGTYRYPFQELLDRSVPTVSGAQARERMRFFLNEHFADLFAVYALGPAYPCACILLRFDPVTAYEVDNQHPSAAHRVHCILRVLKNTG